MDKVFGGKFEMELFNGKNNFALWQSMVQDILTQQGLFQTLEDEKPEDVQESKWADMKRRATSTIRLALAPEIKYDFLEETIPKELMEKLVKVFQSKSLASKLFLKKDLFGLEMEEDGDLRDHLNVFNGLITRLAKLEENFKSEDKAILLLVSLPSKYNNVITSLLVGKTELTLEETVQCLLEAEKLMKQGEGSTSHGGALNVSARGKKKGKKPSPSEVTCFYCDQKGHYQSKCPKAREDLKKLKEAKGGANLVDGEEVIYDALLVESEVESTKEWVLDSGCSFHICHKEQDFVSLRKCEEEMVNLPSGDRVKVEGIGEVVLESHDVIRRFTEVRYIPRLNRNMLSLGRLMEEGCTMEMHQGAILIVENGKAILKAIRNARSIFVVEAYVKQEEVLVRGEASLPQQRCNENVH